MEQKPPRLSPSSRWLLKLGALGAIAIFLLIGLGMVQGIRNERSANRFEAVREIENSWGPPQTLLGPILRIPVVFPETKYVTGRDEKGNQVLRKETVSRTTFAWLMPSTLHATVDLRPEKRARGIYETVVYGAEAHLQARFEWLEDDFAACNEVRWDEAELVLGLSSGRSLRRIPTVTVNGTALRVSPGDATDGWKHTVVADLAALGETPPASLECAITLEAQGVRHLRVAAVAQSQSVELFGSWPHPSFQGPPLPTEREVTENGFRAEWALTEFARGWPRFSIDQESAFTRKDLEATTVGVELMQPVDASWMVGRSLKYGVLFIAVVFTVFLLFEVLAGVRVHPVQYLLVGAALVLFFLLFLALSEIVGVPWGYAFAAIAAVGLIAFYTRHVLRAGRRAWALTGGLVVTYGYLYFVLGSESYALIAGAVALLVLLGSVMWATRRVDWYRLPSLTESAATPEPQTGEGPSGKAAAH